MSILLLPVPAGLVLGIFLSPTRATYLAFAGMAAFLAVLMAGLASRFACFDGTPGNLDCPTAMLYFFLGLLAIYEFFPVVAAGSRWLSLAASDRGDLKAASRIYRAGVGLVALGFTALVGVMFWQMTS